MEKINHRTPQMQNGFRGKFKNLTSNSVIPFLLIIYVLMVSLFYILNPLFLTLSNFKAIMVTAPLLGIVSIGVGIVLLSGNIDISVGAIAGTVALTVSLLLRDTNFNLYYIILIGILLGALIGAFNGFLVNILGVNSVIATLGTWTTLTGVMHTIGGGSVYARNEIFQKLGRGFMFGHIPNVLFMFMVALAAIFILLKFTVFGRSIYLVGANPKSATAIGVKVRKVRFVSFIISGFFASIGGILYSAQLGSFSTSVQLGWELKAITICVVGGITVKGGKGSIIGLFFSWIILGSLQNGFTLINLPIFWREFFWGMMLVIAILVDAVKSKNKDISV